MIWFSWIGIALIALAAVVVAFGVWRSRLLFRAVPFVHGNRQPLMMRFLRLYVLLQLLFLAGYLAAALAIVFRFAFLNDFLLGAILFVSAVSIFAAVSQQTALLREIQETICGFLRVCLKCRKICPPHHDAMTQNSWVNLEEYIAAGAGAQFSHGYCPGCFAEVMKAHAAQPHGEGHPPSSESAHA